MDARSEALLATMQAKPSYEGVPISDKPAFEFITGDGHYYAIFADGRIDGLGENGAGMVINRIPLMINAALTSSPE